jgi:hypothetical protein
MIQILFLIFLNVVKFFHIQIDHDDHQMDPKKKKIIQKINNKFIIYHHLLSIFIRIICTYINIIIIKIEKLFDHYFSKKKNKHTKYSIREKKTKKNDLP